VDGSYASTTPQSVNGTLAEVRFTALKECQTALYLESAALAIRNTEGFATLLPNVSIGERNIALLVDREVGVAHSSKQPESGSILPLDPPKADQSPQEFAALPWLQGLISTLLSHSSGFPGLIAGIMFMTLIGLLIFGTYKLFRFGMAREATNSKSSIRKRKAALHIKHGSQAGKSFVLNRLPILIGRDPQNDICLNDPNVISKHAKIYSERNRYYLRDLGGETFINGHKVRGGAVVLQSGDVVRLGKTAFFVFG
jgi:hypothetical protein